MEILHRTINDSSDRIQLGSRAIRHNEALERGLHCWRVPTSGSFEAETDSGTAEGNPRTGRNRESSVVHVRNLSRLRIGL
jgi:hypothetical protein